jgi:hypothetical protein
VSGKDTKYERRRAAEDAATAAAPVRGSVDVSSTALPTGASTSALQTTGNASLSSIDGKLPALVDSRVPVDPGLTQTAFGDTIVTELRPIVTLKPTYGILDEAETFTATGGSVTVASNKYVLQTGTSVGGYGVLWSRKPVVYVPGVGMESRITAQFTTGVASSIQLAGMFSSTDGMMFGYDGTSFGVMHRYEGALELHRLTVTTPSGGAATVTVTLNTVAYTASITAGTVQQNAHEIEQGLNAGAAASLWHIQHIDDEVIFLYRGVGSKSGTYSVTVSAGAFVANIARVRAGANPTETWTPKASWNKDTASWLTPTEMNAYKVDSGYLGIIGPRFWAWHKTQRRWKLVHTIDKDGLSDMVFGNPTLRVGWASASLGSTTNLTVYGGSAMAGLQGRVDRAHAFGASGVATTVTTETQVLSIQSRREFGGRANNGVLVPKQLTIGTDSTKGAVFKLYRNATVAGNTVHQYVDETESFCTYDAAGTTVSGGRLLGVYAIGPSGRAVVNLGDINEIGVAGDELTITATVSSGGGGADMVAALTWEEII